MNPKSVILQPKKKQIRSNGTMVSTKSTLNQEKIKYFPKFKIFFFSLISKKDFIKKATSCKKNVVAKQNMYRTQLIYCMKPLYNLNILVVMSQKPEESTHDTLLMEQKLNY